MHIRNLIGRIVLLASAAMLSACGGGGDNASLDAAAPDAQGGGSGTGTTSARTGDAGTEDVKEEAGRTIKWNPGHYVVVGVNAGPAMVDQVLSETARFPWVKGIVIRTSWAELERSKGVYDFSVLDSDLSKIAASGKRAFILLGTKSFSVDEKAVPSYLRSAEYGGGAFRIAIKRGGYGENAAIYNDKVAARLQALYQAVGNRYNANNLIEGVIFNETALGMAVKPLTPEQQQGQFKNMARVNIAARSAFANTTLIQFMNSPMKYVPELWRSMQANGIGGGGPDVFVNDKTVNSLLPYYASASGDVPIGVQVESASYYSYKHAGPFAPPSVSSLYTFARDRMKANYMFWVPDTSDPHNPWPKVLGMWGSGSFPRDAAGGLSAQCPSGVTCKSSL